MTAIFSSLTFKFEYFFFCGLLSLQHNTLVLCYKGTFGDHEGWSTGAILCFTKTFHQKSIEIGFVIFLSSDLYRHHHFIIKTVQLWTHLYSNLKLKKNAYIKFQSEYIYKIIWRPWNHFWKLFCCKKRNWNAFDSYTPESFLLVKAPLKLLI